MAKKQNRIFGAASRPASRRGSRGSEKKPTFKENLQALKNLRPFLKLIWETSPSLTITNSILRIIQAAIPLAALFAGKLIIDEVLELINTGSEDYAQLWLYVGIELGLALLSDLLNRGISLVDALLGDLFSNESSVRLMEQAARLDLPQFENSAFYDKLARARQQTTGRVVLMSQLLTQVQDTISILFLGAGLVVFNPWLILLLILAVVPSFLSETYFNRYSYSLTRSWTPERRELDYLRYIGASDETAKEIKIFGLNSFLTSRFSNTADRYYQVNRKLAIRRAIWGGVFNTLGTIGYYVAYVVIILQAISGVISVGDLTFLAGSFSRLRSSLQRILSRFSTIAQSALYLQDYFDFLAIEPKIISPEQALPMPETIQEGFTFENVGFKYPGSETWAVRGLSFRLRAGEKLALVGENGAGKTTLAKLIARLYDPSEGRILLDGKDVRQYDLEALRRAVGVIFQDYVRFQLPVYENIAIGKIDERENRPRIETAAHQSLADSVVAKLENGYDQQLGRRFQGGVELSGGEWQKVALGRAYMRDAQVIILDEPTAALDARAEYEVFERFAELTKDKSAVIISHRFSTVRMADRILVLKKGEMVQIGSHEALMAEEGLYRELFSLQAKGYQ